MAALLRQAETSASVQIPSAWELALNPGRVGNEFRDGVEAGLSTARGVFGRPPPKHAAEPRDRPCLLGCLLGCLPGCLAAVRPASGLPKAWGEGEG